jgi:hypothetical protein
MNLNGKIRGIITNSYILLPAQIGETFLRMRRTNCTSQSRKIIVSGYGAAKGYFQGLSLWQADYGELNVNKAVKSGLMSRIKVRSNIWWNYYFSFLHTRVQCLHMCQSRLLLLILISTVMNKLSKSLQCLCPCFVWRSHSIIKYINTEQQNKCNIKCFLRPKETELLWTLQFLKFDDLLQLW